jgi:putative ABC transport system permease protein
MVLALGLGLGLAGASAATRVLQHQLFAVGPFDPITLAATSLLLAAAGVLATWWPARRAARANPVMSLKES